MAAKKSKQYFTADTEEAIIQYNQTTDDVLRNKLYNQRIKDAINKLAEVWVNKIGYQYSNLHYDDVHHEVIAFLQEKLKRYTQDKGKAFSYFSIVARNYLINKSNEDYADTKAFADLQVVDDSRTVINEVLRAEYVDEKKEFMDLFVEYMERNLVYHFKKRTDLQTADSVLELFRKRENIEEFNKKALYILIRERSGVKTQNITKVVNIFKSVYAHLYMQYKRTGTVSFKPIITNSNIEEFVESE